MVERDLPARDPRADGGPRQASLAKVVCTVKMLETVADAEALYSDEGTREMNTLIVGRAVTGFGIFI